MLMESSVVDLLHITRPSGQKFPLLSEHRCKNFETACNCYKIPPKRYIYSIKNRTNKKRKICWNKIIILNALLTARCKRNKPETPLVVCVAQQLAADPKVT